MTLGGRNYFTANAAATQLPRWQTEGRTYCRAEGKRKDEAIMFMSISITRGVPEKKKKNDT
jgi:hypothetical protein